MPPSERTDILQELRTEWRVVARSTASRRALVALRDEAGDLLPSNVLDLGDLVRALEPRGGLDRLTRARLVEILLSRADDALVRRCLLQTLIPGIVSVARKLRFGEGIADDPRTFLSDTLAEATDLLTDWAGQQRAYAAPDLLGALRCRMRRRMLADKARRAELVAAPDRAGSDDDHGHGTFAHGLAVAAASGDLGVRLLYAKCVLGYSTAELASAVGVSSGAIRRRMVTAAQPFVA
jgi:hypothetical protein